MIGTPLSGDIYKMSQTRCLCCDAAMHAFNDWIFTCDKCDFQLSNLQPGAGRGIDGIEDLRRKNFQTILFNIKKLTSLEDKSLLEVGAAEGWFLEEASQENMDIRCIEPSDHADALKGKGYNVIKGFFPAALGKDNRFDFIIFNDVFEHLPDPVEAIAACEKHLNDDGLLIINIPNSRGLFYRLSKLLYKLGIGKPFDRMWQKGFPSPHITYFSRKNLEQFIDRHTEYLIKEDSFHLSSVSRTGLRSRISSSYSGFKKEIIFLVIYFLSYIMAILPKDIMVIVWRKKHTTREA